MGRDLVQRRKQAVQPLAGGDAGGLLLGAKSLVELSDVHTGFLEDSGTTVGFGAKEGEVD